MKKGFTLVELIVVVALITILAGTFSGRLRDQIAKSRDAKAISLLGAFRASSEAYYAENQEVVYNGEVESINNLNSIREEDKEGIEELASSLNQEARSFIKENGDDYSVEVGGAKVEVKGKVTYGGDIGFTFSAPEGEKSDGINVWFTERILESEDLSYDTKGKKWSKY